MYVLGGEVPAAGVRRLLFPEAEATLQAADAAADEAEAAPAVAMTTLARDAWGPVAHVAGLLSELLSEDVRVCGGIPVEERIRALLDDRARFPSTAGLLYARDGSTVRAQEQERPAIDLPGGCLSADIVVRPVDCHGLVFKDDVGGFTKFRCEHATSRSPCC